ncbi:hypothetical protein E2C01_002648 [Portunus trituberculatus]|uniref:Uncharacterized protein n=1 Tax=Portunus trituberculatus TaxID=210409 RepID=A0A5B7CRB4_PORTR|nr:hypothetical protein [Portunus trituberculatus]
MAATEKYTEEKLSCEFCKETHANVLNTETRKTERPCSGLLTVDLGTEEAGGATGEQKRRVKEELLTDALCMSRERRSEMPSTPVVLGQRREGCEHLTKLQLKSTQLVNSDSPRCSRIHERRATATLMPGHYRRDTATPGNFQKRL